MDRRWRWRACSRSFSKGRFPSEPLSSGARSDWVPRAFHFPDRVLAVAAAGSWLSGYFILVTNAFMQHPVGYRVEADGSLGIDSLSAYLLNPWAWVQFAHNQMAALVTGSFVVAAVGAFYCLRSLHPVQARMYHRAPGNQVVGLMASMLVAFPTGDQRARMVGREQPVTLAAMEGRFVGGSMASVAVIGQPNVAARRLDNPIELSHGPQLLWLTATSALEVTSAGWTTSPRSRGPTTSSCSTTSFHLA